MRTTDGSQGWPAELRAGVRRFQRIAPEAPVMAIVKSTATGCTVMLILLSFDSHSQIES